MGHTVSNILFENNHEQRLINAMACCIVEKGYVQTTIADIVKSAHVSKRTFYEYFADKEACLLACYSAQHDQVMRLLMLTPFDSSLPWDSRIIEAFETFLRGSEAHMHMMNTLTIEVLAAGARGLQIRQQSHQRFIELLRVLPKQSNALPPLSNAMATAIVGGIHEVILNVLAETPEASIEQLLCPLKSFLRSMFFELAKAQPQNQA